MVDERLNMKRSDSTTLKQGITSNAGDTVIENRWQALRKYTDAYINKKSKTKGIGKIISGLLTSPDYSLKDFKAIIVNGYKKNVSLWKEILHLDLSAKLANVKIPYSIIQGETDVVASTTLVRNIVSDSGNNNLTLDIIKKQRAHSGKRNDGCCF